MIKQKFKEWLNRYLPPEIIGTVTAIGVASIVHAFSENHILIAYSGSLGESVGFYSTVLIQNFIIANKKHTIENKIITFSEFIKIFKNIVLEFGPAGLIDGLLLRPFFMVLFPVLLKNFTLGIFLGKIAGDITFYILVILSYEIRKKRKKITQIENCLVTNTTYDYTDESKNNTQKHLQ